MKHCMLAVCLLLAACASTGHVAPEPKPRSEAKTEEPRPEAKVEVPRRSFEEWRSEGERLMREEKWAEALPCFERAAAMTSDAHSELYNIACCHSRLGHEQLAVDFLWKAFEAGVDNYPYVAADTDLIPLMGFGPFERFMETLKEHYESWQKRSGEPLFVEAPVLHEIRVRLPDDLDKERKYPLVIALHEYGGNAANFAALYDRISYKSAFIFAAINGPYAVPAADENPGGRWWWLHGAEDDGWQRSRAALVQAVVNTRKRLCEKYAIDERNVYLLGYRQGGTAAMLVCSTEWKQFAGFMSIGAHHLGAEPKVEGKFAALLCHGRDDEKLSFEACDEAKEIWSKAGAEVSVEELVEWSEIGADTTSAIAAWLFTQIEARSED